MKRVDVRGSVRKWISLADWFASRIKMLGNIVYIKCAEWRLNRKTVVIFLTIRKGGE